MDAGSQVLSSSRRNFPLCKFQGSQTPSTKSISVSGHSGTELAQVWDGSAGGGVGGLIRKRNNGADKAALPARALFSHSV